MNQTNILSKFLNRKAILSALLIIIAIISFILAIECKNYDAGEYEPNNSYGGDAYTGIQQAAATTARNEKVQTEAICSCFSAVLTVAGLTLLAIGVTGLLPETISLTAHTNAYQPGYPSPIQQNPIQNNSASPINSDHAAEQNINQ